MWSSRLLVMVSLSLVLAGSATAETLTSASYRHVGGSPASVSATSANALTSSAADPKVGSFEISVGEAPTVLPSGSPSDLESVLPGFWSRFLSTVGGPASIDLDGDGIAFFLDPDGDGDGLEDFVETATGMFVSALNTGSSPFLPDSDGDGINDGVEVLAGSDPNDRTSRPPAQVPSAGLVSLLMLIAAMTAIGSRALIPRRSMSA